jgi:flavorubredoxin
MKSKKKEFQQHLYHDIDNEEDVEEYLDSAMPLIGEVVMYFNSLEKSLDSQICETFTFRSDSTGLIVLHKMSYSTKVELFKRFSDDFQLACDEKIENYDELIKGLKESGRLRNLVVHADWENTDNDGFTYISLKISKSGMHQEYIQFSEESLKDIIRLIFKTHKSLSDFRESRMEILRN